MSKARKKIQTIYLMARAREMLKQGIAVSAIAKELNISYAHAKNLCAQELNAAHGVG